MERRAADHRWWGGEQQVTGQAGWPRSGVWPGLEAAALGTYRNLYYPRQGQEETAWEKQRSGSHRARTASQNQLRVSDVPSALQAPGLNLRASLGKEVLLLLRQGGSLGGGN